MILNRASDRLISIIGNARVSRIPYIGENGEKGMRKSSENIKTIIKLDPGPAIEINPASRLGFLRL